MARRQGELKAVTVERIERAIHGPSGMARQYTASNLARLYGCSPRYWTRLAAAGKIPGARQPSGPMAKWLFDAAVFEKWWQSREHEVRQWPVCSVEGKYIGVVPNVTTEDSGAASRRRTEKLLSDVLGSGSTS